MTERLCKDCDGIVDLVSDEGLDGWDGDLMCVVCGAALSLGGLLLGELAAREADAA